MMVEIGLLQRMSVFLGHPIYSLSVVLFSLILTTGIGSMVSDRWPLDHLHRFSVWSLLVGGYLLALPVWLPETIHALEDEALLLRVGAAVATIAPAGFLMGFGFPTGMRLVAALDNGPTPWFWGVNGVAGVLAAIVAVASSIALGVSFTMAIGGACYLLLIPPARTIGFRPGAQIGRRQG